MPGRLPRARVGELTLIDLVNRFLTAKERAVTTGEIRRRTFEDYDVSCRKLLEHFGRDRLVNDLAPDDFAELKEELAKTVSLVRLGNEIQRIKTIFKFAYEQDLIKRPVKYGATFNKPNRKTLRRDCRNKPQKFYESDELRTLIETAGARDRDEDGNVIATPFDYRIV